MLHLPRPALIAAMALLFTSPLRTLHAEPLEGTLECGPAHSVLWFVSPESGDLIGQVFANDSQAGRNILSNCLPDLLCAVEDGRFADPPEELLPQLDFSSRPSGWWLIEQASNAHMQPNLPMDEKALRTRYGTLSTSAENWMLLLDDRPVLAAPAQVREPEAPPPAANAAVSDKRSLLQRIADWWNRFKATLQSRLPALFGRSNPETPAAVSDPVISDDHRQPAGTAKVVQGNFSFMAHYEMQGRDIVLLQNTGGTACPALYRFATLTPQGIALTEEFGTCSDIASIVLSQDKSGDEAPLVAMVGTHGDSFDSAEERKRAPIELRRFILHQGQVKEIPSAD